MNYHWSLNELYEGFDSEAFLSDLKKADALLKTLDESSKSLKDTFSMEQYFKATESFEATIQKLYSFCNLTFSTDTKHEDALKYMDKVMTLYQNASVLRTRLTAFLSTVADLDVLISPSEYLKSIEFIILEEKEQSAHILSEAEERIASKLSLTGSYAWETLQSKLTSTLTADVKRNGTTETLPIASVRNMAYDADATVRKSAYEAEIKAYEKIDEAVALSLNSIKGEVITMSALRGYDSPLARTLSASRMTEKTLNAMLNAMKNYLPDFHRYLQTKAKLMGHENGLPFYDLFAPVGTASRKYSYEEGCDFVLKNFRTFSDKLYQSAKDAMDKSWIDVKPREGKVNGAFCSDQHSIGEFRVMLNYTGNLSDVTTLAHELGHGYHAMCAMQENILMINAPMPLAETASTFCETIVNNAVLKEATTSEKMTILENSLQDATQVICDIYSRYLFESQLFENRGDHPLSVDELKNIMLDAQMTAYGDGLDPEIRHPYMWLIKPHYYSAGLNFYNFPYAFGLLFAKGLYAKYLDSPEYFVKHYDTLLAAAGKMKVIDVCKIMDIDVESEAFWNTSLEIIKEDIETFIALAEDTLNH